MTRKNACNRVHRRKERLRLYDAGGVTIVAILATAVVFKRED